MWLEGRWPFIPVRVWIAAGGANITDSELALIHCITLILLLFNMPEKNC